MRTSETPGGCFVYLTLPGQLSAVTAGRFEVGTGPGGPAVGRFVYGRRYLENRDAVEIDPVTLKLSSRTYETTGLRGIFGALRDAGPDHWGRQVIERRTKRAGLGELEYLLLSPDDHAGALGFGTERVPPPARTRSNRIVELETLQAIADALVAGEEGSEDAAAALGVDELLLIGTSMGGARPKAVVEDESGLLLAKFNRTDDRWNQARVEDAMLRLARSCGITTARSRVVTVGGRDVLLCERFDRERTDAGYLRARMVSGLTLLDAGEAHSDRDRWSYLLLVEELRRVSATPKEDAAELWRRMCFNALISNLDDHPRNHALVALGRNWGLSPAYDLTPSVPVSLERRDLALTVGDAGRYANAENLLSQCGRFLLPREEAVRIVADMRDRVRTTWRTVAREAGVSPADCRSLEGAFAYPGFDYTSPPG